MKLDQPGRMTVFHNRRFARRSAGGSVSPSVLPSIRRPVRPQPLRAALLETIEPQSTVLPQIPQISSPLDDTRFVAECAEGILNSLSNAIIALDETGRVKTVNAAGLQMLGVTPAQIVGRPAQAIFVGANAWLLDRLAIVAETGEHHVTRGAELVFRGTAVTVNATVFPLIAGDGAETLGTMIMLDDISAERRMKSTMAHYLDPAVVDRLLSGPGDRLESQDTVASVLFSDVRGFTQLTEELGAQQAVKLLNEYFTLMVECITAEGGMLYKFIGDAIMAGFGVTDKRDDEEDRAVRAGIAMLKALDKWNAQRKSTGQKPISIGIGISTDSVVSGTIGSPTRMDYTLIGDGVNIASRLESACKHYKTRFLIGEHTYKKLRGAYKIREIDEVVVHGKTLPIRVYEGLDHHTEATFPNMDAAIALFAEARALYAAGDWDKAIAKFWEVLALNPQDQIATLYIDRCQEMKTHPPRHWNGVWTLETK